MKLYHYHSLTLAVMSSVWMFLAAIFSFAAEKQISATVSIPQTNTIGFFEMKTKADAGDVEAIFDLGRRLFQGEGVAVDKGEAVNWWRKAATLGDAQSMYWLGVCYETGDGVKADFSESMKWYRKAAELKYTSAMLVLGNSYAFGKKGVTENKVEAIKWYREAAELGDADAMSLLGGYLACAESTLDNQKEAIQWWRKAASLTNAFAMYNLGFCYLRGFCATNDISMALEWFQRSADFGNVAAMLELGNYYNQISSTNKTEAYNWYRKAADLGSASAMRQLGRFYFYGVNVSVNKSEAVKLWRNASDLGDNQATELLSDYNLFIECTRAANLGDAIAMTKLGKCYGDGKGVHENKAEAVRWYRKAAERGHIEAVASLGLCYAHGVGVPEDKTEAMSWFRKGADLGADRMMVLYIECFDVLNKVPKDRNDAVKWYRKLADLGNSDAMLLLGVCYDDGIGVPQDDIYAYVWFSLAAAKNSCVSFRDKVRNRMTPSQLAEAQKVATTFFERNGRVANIGIDSNDSRKTKPISIGTGFFVTINGFLLTACHVVAKSGTIKVSAKGKVVEAKVVQSDIANDVALLKVDGLFCALGVVSSRGVKLGADIFTLGFPNVDIQGISPKFTKGTISAISGIQDDPRAFQVSVPIQPGNSGGPLLDASGNVIGVVVSQLDAVKTALLTGSLPQGVNYAVKSAYVQPLLDAIPETSAIPPASKARPFDEAVKAAEAAVCIVLAYEAAP